MTLALLVTIAAAAPEAAKPSAVVTKHEAGPVLLQVHVDSPIVPLSDEFPVSITISAPARVVIKGPYVEKQPGCFEVVGVDTDGPDRFNGLFGPLQLLKWTLRFDPMQLGDCELGAFSFEYKDEELDWQRATIGLPRVKVVPGLVKAPDPATLRPLPNLPPPTTPLSPPSPMRWLRWAGTALFVVTVLLWLARAVWNRPSLRSLTLDALDELQQIERGAQNAISPRDEINRVCDIVRAYLERAYRLDAPTQTTPEFLADARTADVLSGDQRTALTELLESADAERFAAAEPTQEHARRCLRRGRAFLAGELM